MFTNLKTAKIQCLDNHQWYYVFSGILNTKYAELLNRLIPTKQ